MFCRLSQAFANFHKREDGPTTTEYAVMLALLVVGCVVALALRGAEGTFTISLRDGRNRASATKDDKSRRLNGTMDDRAQKNHEIRTVATEDGTDTSYVYLTNRSQVDAEAKKENSEAPSKLNAGSKSSHALTSPKTTNGDKTMSEDDLRQAIIGLLKAYPGSFATSKDTIQAAPIVHKADYTEINLFRCRLQTKRFAYGTLPAGPGQFREEKSGVFYQDKNGEWTGKITTMARK